MTDIGVIFAGLVIAAGLVAGLVAAALLVSAAIDDLTEELRHD